MEMKMKRITNWPCSLITVVMLIFSAGALASPGHGHEEKGGGRHQGMEGGDHHGKEAMFLKKKEIDGYTVSFHIMEAKKGMEHGGSHNFMLKVEKDGRALNDIVVNSKVIHPDGSSQMRKLSRMGDWYMAGYDLGHEGEHQVMVLFKTPDGNMHRGGVFY